MLISPFYLSNKSENNLPIYIGNNFIQNHNYNAGEWVVYLGYWYKYIANGNGTLPNNDSSAERQNEYKFFLSNKLEMSSQNDFIVKVPSQCYNNMSDNDFLKIKTIINYYKLVNKTYTIISY